MEELPNYLEFTIKEPRPLKDIFPFASEGCIDLLEGLLQLDPVRRLSASEALAHPYFSKEEPRPCENKELPLPVKK